MGRTIAEALKSAGLKEGLKKGRNEGLKEGELRLGRQTLLHQLRQRFGHLPDRTVAAVEATTNVEQLNAWLGRVIGAHSLQDMGID